MTSNNNLSVLPWYTSIEQQNARKWWIYDRIYPLFAPGDSLLPFQLMREHRLSFLPGEQLLAGYFDDGVLTPQGEWMHNDDYDVCGFEDMEQVAAIYFEDLPKPPATYVSMVAYNSQREVVGVYTPEFPDGQNAVSGGWVLPPNTSYIYVQTDDEINDIHALIFEATTETLQVAQFEVYKSNGELFNTYDPAQIGITVIPFESLGYDVILFPGQLPVFSPIPNGQYYALMSDGIETWYSEVFTVVNDISPYLKIEWWDMADFVMDAGTIVYKYSGDTQFKNVLFLQADIAKPEYIFEEEGESRDGYFFPTKQISEKHYRFAFLASEYLLDVMRFIRMADYARIQYHGQTYNLDTFLITPEWEDNGDVAAVTAEFDTDTVAKKIGLAYIKAQNN